MTDDTNSVFPETQANIYHARCLSDLPWEQRLTPYAGIGMLLEERVKQGGERNWLTFYDDSGRSSACTLQEFDHQVRRAATFMSERLGLKAGDRISTLMVNDPSTVMVYFSAWLIGVTVAPINCGEDNDRIAYILANAGVSHIFALSDQIERCLTLVSSLEVAPGIVQVGGEAPAGCNIVDFYAEVMAQTPLATLPDVGPDTEALIIYTSGTTGPPKGVVLDHANLLADACSIAQWHGFGPEDRAMNVLPIHHVNGIVVTLITPLYSGGSVVLNRRFRVMAFWRTLAEEKCTWCSVVPTVLAFLCERGSDIAAYDLTRFRHIICGAGPLTVDLARRFHDAFGIRVVHGYGLSETTCYSCFLPADLDNEEYRFWMTECGYPSIGCAITANEMEIQDDQGIALEPGKRGEICIRGHNVMKYYFLRPEANRDTFAHGWFRSGDEGFYQVGEDGQPYYFITGRLKELIIRGGVNYSPFDIDEVLSALPGVKAAMAVGFENDFYGEEIGAYVQKEEGVTLTEEEIIRACQAKLPYSKSPKVVVFGDTFPVTSTGKYQRNKLKPLFAQWKGVQFREAK